MRVEPPDARETGRFFRLAEIDAGDAHALPDGFDRMREGALHGILVRGVYPPELLAPLVDRLERHDPPFLKTWFPAKFRSWFYGRNLNLAEPSLPGYFDEAKEFDAHLEQLFPRDQGLAARVGGILSRLDHGRPFAAPPGAEPGSRYMFTTLRAHLEGGYIPAHFDNEQALRPSYAHLRSLVEPHMSSFVLCLAAPQGGGALEIFDLRCEPSQPELLSDDRVGRRPDLSGLESVAFRLAPGEMIVLDSGRYLHRVTPVEGSLKRWTACSFMALSRRRDAMYCWG